MNRAPATGPVTIADRTILSQESSGGMLSLRIALDGAPLLTLAQALARLDGVRVTAGPEAADRPRGYLVHCPGFKMALSASSNSETADHAVALVSRSPQAALTIMSDLGATLDRLMTEPTPPAEAEPAQRLRSGFRQGDAAPLRRSSLKQGAPLARKTSLTRKTPLARGRFNRV